MQTYKAPDNSIHAIDPEFEHLLPAGCVPITEAEAQEIRFVPEPAVIYSCTPWQIRKALNAQGLRSAAESAVAASTEQALKDGWEFATEFRSDDPFVIAMGSELGKTAEETAQFIQYAATL